MRCRKNLPGGSRWRSPRKVQLNLSFQSGGVLRAKERTTQVSLERHTDKIGRAEITALIPSIIGDKMRYCFQDFKEERRARGDLLHALSAGPGRKHEFEPEQRTFAMLSRAENFQNGAA